MFLSNSRYAQVKQRPVTTKDGHTVKIVEVRRLPSPSGTPTVIKDHDRLDIMAQRQYKDPTRFWRIADANTELEARKLTEETGRIIDIPEQ